MRGTIACLILSILLAGCSSNEPSSRVSAAHVVQIVQDSESTYPGVKTADAIAGLLKIMQSRGGFIDIAGWSQDFRSGGTHDVWFKVKTDGELSEFHWVITPDGMINPANELARSVTKVQAAKP